MASFVNKPWLRHYPAGVPAGVDVENGPVWRLLDRAADQHPQATATVFFGSKLTWGEIRRQADTFAAVLAGLGVKPGDRVAIMLPNVPQAFFAYFGVLKAGAVAVFFNPLYVEREIEHQLKDCGAETMIAMDLFVDRIRNVQAATDVKRLIVTSIKDFMSPVLRLLLPVLKPALVAKVTPRSDTYRMTDLLGAYAGKRPPSVPVDPVRDVAVLQYTGGTTGVSKGAQLTHRNLVANAVQVRTWMGELKDGEERILAIMPLFHSYGLTTCFHVGAIISAALILVPKFELKQVLGLIHKQKPTIFPGAPTIYVAINNSPEVSKYNLSSVKACISGAAALPVEVQAKFESLTGGRLVEGYGLTEASPVTHCTPLFGERVAGSIGLPLPSTDMKIVDLETGLLEVEPGQEGELCIRGPQVMAGYWNRPEETARTIRDGWLHTGDIAKMDEEGWTYIVDRAKDMIIAGGYNVYPREVEEVLYEHPAIQEACVAGLPDEYRGQTVKAYIVLKPGLTATADEIIHFCRERMAKYKSPTTVEFRESLPKTMIGKVLRRVLLEEDKQRAAAGAERAG